MRAPKKVAPEKKRKSGSCYAHWTPPDKEWLEHQYLRLQKSPRIIGHEVGVDRATVYWWLVDAGIPRRSHAEAMRLTAGKRHYGWQGGSRARGSEEAARLMQEAKIPYCCGHCGATGVRLVVHHKNRNWRDNDLGSLQYLCYTCHLREHEGETLNA